MSFVDFEPTGSFHFWGREQDRNGQESQGRCLQRQEGEDSLRPEARTPDDQQTGQGGE